MKKLIFVLSFITFTIVSFLSIKQFEYLEFQAFNYDVNHSQENFDLEIREGNPQKDKIENFQILSKIAMQSKVNLQRTSHEIATNKQEKIVYYVTLYDSNQYFKQMKLKTGEFLNSNSNPDTFLSTIQTNNKNQIGQIEIFHNFNPIEIRPMIAAASIKDIRGTYTLNNSKNVKLFKQMAENNGFSIKIAKKESTSVFTEYPYQTMIYTTSFVLCLLLLLAMSYDVMNNYKAIAIQYMHGDSFFQIGVYLLRRYVNVILGSFLLVSMSLLIYLYYYNQYQQIVPFLSFWIKNISLLFLVILLIIIITWIGSKSIHISQMIKNKKPIKLFFYSNLVIRFILAVFLILALQQGISTFNELKRTTAQQEKWKLMKDYASLGMEVGAGDRFDIKNEDNLNRFNNLYKELENQGAVYIAPSYYYLNQKDNELNPNPWGVEGKQIVINKNYLLLNPIYGINNKKIQLPRPNKSEITVLVPKRYEDNQEDIKTTVKKDYSMMLNHENPDSVQINILYVKNEQSYFTFTPQMAVDTNYQIIDPIVVILTHEFEPMYTSSSIAMGYGYYTKNVANEFPFKKTKETIEKYNFDNIWSPVSIAYSLVEQKISNDTEKLQLTIISCTLFLVLSAVLLFFSAIYYLEMFKQVLALQWVFGYSFFEKHNVVYLALLVFWQFSFMVCFFLSNNRWLLFKISLGLAICDILLMSILLIAKERKITKLTLLGK
ncbi:DUF1430 domain-containing protein [Bacillus mycoides]|uniref:DUF1430 domain-containing protein n=1 Tax=Bacillus mycoides TaxID=1405 RepID=A0A4U3ADW8_BACMY|nr:DUF1430 domain-containing protein [Bacillus mycoides]TKI85898.1 DUF1430 domain-containing protein [Bacillus mycoides]